MAHHELNGSKDFLEHHVMVEYLNKADSLYATPQTPKK